MPSHFLKFYPSDLGCKKQREKDAICLGTIALLVLGSIIGSIAGVVLWPQPATVNSGDRHTAKRSVFRHLLFLSCQAKDVIGFGLRSFVARSLRGKFAGFGFGEGKTGWQEVNTLHYRGAWR
jgi:hypothetical protein